VRSASVFAAGVRDGLCFLCIGCAITQWLSLAAAFESRNYYFLSILTHDCVTQQNKREFKAIALCDIAPPQNHIASQLVVLFMLNASDSAGFAYHPVRHHRFTESEFCVLHHGVSR
jgi:hypothetical protein